MNMTAGEFIIDLLANGQRLTPEAAARLLAEAKDVHAHELADQIRKHPVYSDSKATWHRHTLYGFAGESFKAQEELDALTEAIVESLAGLVDPEAKR
jgi:hypothetical protein